MDEVEEFNVIRKELFDKAGVPHDGVEYVAPMNFAERVDAIREIHRDIDEAILDAEEVCKLIDKTPIWRVFRTTSLLRESKKLLKQMDQLLEET